MSSLSSSPSIATIWAISISSTCAIIASVVAVAAARSLHAYIDATSESAHRNNQRTINDNDNINVLRIKTKDATLATGTSPMPMTSIVVVGDGNNNQQSAPSSVPLATRRLQSSHSLLASPVVAYRAIALSDPSPSPSSSPLHPHLRTVSTVSPQPTTISPSRPHLSSSSSSLVQPRRMVRNNIALILRITWFSCSLMAMLGAAGDALFAIGLFVDPRYAISANSGWVAPTASTSAADTMIANQAYTSWMHDTQNSRATYYGLSQFAFASQPNLCDVLSKFAVLSYLLTKLSSFVFFFFRQRSVRPLTNWSKIEYFVFGLTMFIIPFSFFTTIYSYTTPYILDGTCDGGVPVPLVATELTVDIILSTCYLYLFLRPLLDQLNPSPTPFPSPISNGVAQRESPKSSIIVVASSATPALELVPRPSFLNRRVSPPTTVMMMMQRASSPSAMANQDAARNDDGDDIDRMHAALINGANQRMRSSTNDLSPLPLAISSGSISPLPSVATRVRSSSVSSSPQPSGAVDASLLPLSSPIFAASTSSSAAFRDSQFTGIIRLNVQAYVITLCATLPLLILLIVAQMISDPTLLKMIPALSNIDTAVTSVVLYSLMTRTSTKLQHPAANANTAKVAHDAAGDDRRSSFLLPSSASAPGSALIHPRTIRPNRSTLSANVAFHVPSPRVIHGDAESVTDQPGQFDPSRSNMIDRSMKATTIMMTSTMTTTAAMHRSSSTNNINHLHAYTGNSARSMIHRDSDGANMILASPSHAFSPSASIATSAGSTPARPNMRSITAQAVMMMIEKYDEQMS